MLFVGCGAVTDGGRFGHPLELYSWGCRVFGSRALASLRAPPPPPDE